MNFSEKVKRLLLESPSKTYDALKDDSLSIAIKYYAHLVILYVAFSGLGGLFGWQLFGPRLFYPSKPEIIGTNMGHAIAISILLFILTFIAGAILHIGVYIVGSRKEFSKTLKALIYSYTPGLSLGWIPFIGIFGVIVSFILVIIGTRQLHEITTGKAIIASIIPIVILTILPVFLVIYTIMP